MLADTSLSLIHTDEEIKDFTLELLPTECYHVDDREEYTELMGIGNCISVDTELSDEQKTILGNFIMSRLGMSITSDEWDKYTYSVSVAEVYVLYMEAYKKYCE